MDAITNKDTRTFPMDPIPPIKIEHNCPIDFDVFDSVLLTDRYLSKLTEDELDAFLDSYQQFHYSRHCVLKRREEVMRESLEKARRRNKRTITMDAITNKDTPPTITMDPIPPVKIEPNCPIDFDVFDSVLLTDRYLSKLTEDELDAFLDSYQQFHYSRHCVLKRREEVMRESLEKARRRNKRTLKKGEKK